ncbi:hypothetical protein [Citrobacter sp. FDAARGOS_156]|uniref:hypothetical protein n=1 Tax=Citrobacter sp. FDAARGOS_156 TaxID=1702170 RepID=UPI001F24E5C6|nr:hypothetical protein [Citrobacter sp. FDAARGOS_156]
MLNHSGDVTDKAEPVNHPSSNESSAEPSISVIYKDGWPEPNSVAPIAGADKLPDGVHEFYAAPPAPVVPETLPCPVHLEPGLKFGKGVRTQCVLDALRRRADYYAELEAMTPEQRADHDAGIAEFKAMLGTSQRDSFKMPEELLSAMEEVLRISDRDHEAWHKARNGIASCRAAMLQAGNHTERHLDMVGHSGDTNKKGRDGTLINEGTIPATRFQTVADLYGITSPTGSETSFTFDAFEASSFAKVGWSVQEYVELERYQQAVTGNSTVTPDGWQLVPKEPTQAMNKAGWDAMNEHDAINPTYRAMLAAAPKQENF